MKEGSNIFIRNAELLGYTWVKDAVREYKFCDSRKWRIDIAFPKKALAVEIEGGIWSRGRHTRGLGFLKDIEKYNALTIMGWRLLRYTPQMANATAYDQIKYCLEEL